MLHQAAVLDAYNVISTIAVTADLITVDDMAALDQTPRSQTVTLAQEIAELTAAFRRSSPPPAQSTAVDAEIAALRAELDRLSADLIVARTVRRQRESAVAPALAQLETQQDS